MRCLLDTHILIWAAGDIDLIPEGIKAILDDERNELLFSPASIWETAIKHGKGRADFTAEPLILRQMLTENGYSELPINSDHAMAIAELPLIHKDPFDRILIAQSMVEGVPFVTVDVVIRRYPGLIIV